MSRHLPAQSKRKTAKLADLLDWQKERFVRRCQIWPSAQALADDLTAHGFECSVRQAGAWRSRQLKKMPGDANFAVRWLLEEHKTREALGLARAIKELADEDF